MPEIILADQLFTYQVRRHPRQQTIRLKILSAETLEISAPSSLPLPEIDRLLQMKCNWILKKAAHLRVAAANPVNTTLAVGAQLLYLGRAYLLHFSLINTGNPGIILSPNTITVEIAALDGKDLPGAASKLLRIWYTQNAYRLFAEKTAFWAGRLAVQPMKIGIRDQKTRWGSCSSRGSIQYNWRIVMAPPEIMDYLVIHELCHLRIPNHSRNFWELVAEFMPEYRQRRTWLKNNGPLLTKIL